jgi:lambda family phage tail tape measure protein
MAQTSRLVIELDSRDAEAKAADTRKALEALEDAGLSIQPALNKAGAGMESMGKSAEKASKSVSAEADELEQLLGQIDPVVRRLGDLDKQEQALAQHRKAGRLDTATYNEYQAKIAASRAELGRFNADMSKTGISAKQTAAALRGVPAQFTDIATSLQGGQAPLTVFLQQGGQLKDMFGGVGPAAKALGGYVASLITPFTLAGAAVAGFTLAAYKGYEQAEQYRKALTMSGDAAGKTADDLIALSNAIAGGRNFEEAGQAVLALAGNGRLTGEAFTEVARAATELSVATGKSAADIADQLSSTKGSVTDLAAEYSDKYGIITQAVFDQVRSLEQQGQRMEAVRVLAGAVADEMGARNKEMVESTRGLAKAWDDVKTSVSGVWNELKAGLSASPELFKLQHLQGQLQDAQKIGDKALIAGLEKQVSLAQAAVDAQTQKKESVSAELQERKATIAADKAWSDDGLKYRSNQQKMEKEIADARTKGLAAKVSEAEIEKRIGQIREDYANKEKKPTAPKAYNEDAGMKMLDSSRQAYAVLVQQNAAISDQGTSNEKLGTQAQALIRWEQQLADIKSKGTLTADQKALLASQDLITAQLKKNSALEKEVELRKASKEEAEKLAAFQANQNSRLGTAQDGLDSQVAGMGLGSEARDRLKQDLAIQRDYARQSADLLEQRNTGRITQDLYDKESAVIQDGLSKRLAMQQNYYSQIDTYQSNWLNGVTAGWNSYAEISRNTAQQTQDIVTGSLDTITTGFGNSFSAMALDGATFSDVLSSTFEGLVRGVLDGLGQMAAQWLINQGIQLAFGQTETALHATKLAMIGTETAAATTGAATVAAAKVTADGVATASSLAATATTTTAQVAAAGTTLASWLPAALVASIGSFGAAAVVGGGALLAAFALIKGFSNGGYTGAGGVNEPAGTVHKGEVVWSQADIRKAGGVATVEAMRKGNVSAGLPTSGGVGSTSASNGVPAQERLMVVNLHEDSSRAGQVSRRQLGEQDVIDICVANIRGEKELHQVNQEKYGLQSQGV